MDKRKPKVVKDRSGLGWSLADFGIASGDRVPSANPNRPDAPLFKGPGAAASTAAAAFTLGLTGGETGQRVIPTTPTTLPKPLTQSPVNPRSDTMSQTQASNFLTPEQQGQVQNYLEDPNMVQATLDVAKDWMSNLFDIEDPEKEAAFGLERPWDAMLTGLNWAYDKINQGGSWLNSAAPGGIETFGWDDAAKVSWGQSAISANAALVNQAEKIGGPLGGLAGAAVANAMNPVGIFGSVSALGDSPIAPYGAEGFDVLNEQQRKAAFEDSTVGKWTSGLTDAFITVFADPLLYAGKGAKLARIRWVDRPMTVEQATTELATGATRMFEARNGVIAADAAEKQMSPIALFAKWTTDKAEDGTKLISVQEIYNHPVVKRAANRDGLAAALYSADNYDEASLVIRYAKGDVKAFEELSAKRADIIADMAAAHKSFLETMMLYNPTAKVNLENKYKEAANKMADELTATETRFGINSAEAAFARAQVDQVTENLVFVSNYRLPNPLVTQTATKEQVQAARKAIDEITKRNGALSRALGSERDRLSANYYSMGLSSKGFAADNAFGRAVERSRQGRATAAYQQATTRGALVGTGEMITREVTKINSKGEKIKVTETTEKMKKLRPWERDEFNNPGYVRAARLWRWMSNETPSGFVTTKGVGALESTREIQASLNDIAIYSGPARRIIIDGEEIMVGGMQRKDELVRMYMDALSEAGVRGTADTKSAVDALEAAIQRDISVWHGINRSTFDLVMTTANRKRQSIIDSVKNTGYWVEDVGSGKLEVNHSPYLESQFQNGTFMHNWKAVEKAARLYDETAWIKTADDIAQLGAEKFQNAYGVFNDIWRPAVLMRLGYTQRNVTEGLFRSSAYLFSLDPLRYAAGNAAYGVRNLYVSRRMSGAVEAATVAQRTGKTLPKKFEKWKAKQVAARDDATSRLEASIREIEEGAASFSQEIKGRLLQRYVDDANEANTQLANAIKNNADPKEIAGARAALQYSNDKITEINKIKIQPATTPESQQALDSALGNLPFLDDMLTDSRWQRDLLNQDDSAVAMFRQQAKAKRRVFDGQQVGPDGIVLRDAFDRNSDYTDVAWMNMSADNTTKATMSLQMQAMTDLLRAKRMRFYVQVNPGDKGYFQGVGEMLRQFQTSAVGNMVVKGKSRDDIALFLRKTPEGREIAAALGKAQVRKKGNGMTFSVIDLDDALEYADEVIARYNQLAPSPELQDFLKSNFLSEKADMGETVRTFLDRTTPAGTPMYDLKPAIGNVAEEMGHPSVMDIWRSGTSAAFKVLGTMPEDALVRGPFYGTRYKSARDAMIREVQQSTGEKITMNEVAQIQRIAHRRALKDTKDWLYTIDRRTNLGRSGEYVLPFISAAQNSVTTVGRILWNDPSVIALMIQMWRAPTKMGIEDEQGNIHIPIPHSLLPDGMEEALGLSNMMDFTINKGSLNVVMPESGFGFIPRFGPLVAAPVSEMMKHGWFGQSVEAPEIFVDVLGKEAANQLWTGWKSYVFGEGQGIAPDPGSLSMFLPPVLAKIHQMWQGEGSSSQYAYYYNLQFRNEMAQWAGGYRDEPPTAEEIKQRTNGFYAIRILANLTAFTPPGYESKLDPIIKAIRNNDRNYGIDGGRMSNDQFGNLLLMLGDFSNTKNVAGTNPTADAVGNARKYSDLIKSVSADLGDDLSVIGMILNDDPNAYYDDSAYGWQLSNQIPGVTERFRELQTPEQSWRESQKNAGWTAYIKLMDGLDALLQERGLKSFRSSQAQDLRQMKNDAIEQLRGNPLYAGWYDDYIDFGSTRTSNAVDLMRAALSDEKFVADHAESPVWQAANEYLFHRDLVLDVLKQRGTGINNEDNKDIREHWDTIRADLIAGDNGWGTYANRYLNGDDDPVEPSTQFADFNIVDVPAGTDLTQGTIPASPQEDTFGGMG